MGLGRSGHLVPWSSGPLVPWSPLLVFGIKLFKKLQCARPCFACALLNGAVQVTFGVVVVVVVVRVVL